MKKNIHSLGAGFKEFKLTVPENFHKLQSAILSSTDGYVFWIWRYVTLNDRLHHQPLPEPIQSLDSKDALCLNALINSSDEKSRERTLVFID